MAVLHVIDLDRCDYDTALALQTRLVAHRKAHRSEDGHLVLVEHDPPVITRGRRGGDRFLLTGRDELARRGIDLRDTKRGGDVTYHGPGQLVGYPVFDLTAADRSVHGHIRRLEQVLIDALARFDVRAERVAGLTGVWVGDEKIAAIGIAVTRWVTYHGFALNVNTDLSHFGLIVPCGIADRGVTSLARLLGRPIEMAEVAAGVLECFQTVFGFQTLCALSPEQVPSE
jgi:lipoate-protein ligase B